MALRPSCSGSALQPALRFRPEVITFGRLQNFSRQPNLAARRECDTWKPLQSETGVHLMPLTDSQLAGLIQLVLLQQQDILALHCGQVALLRIAHESGVEDVETRF